MGLFDKWRREKEPRASTKTMREETEGLYDYSTAEGRARTAEYLLRRAKNERTGQEELWRRYEDYYNGAHDVAAELREQLQWQGVDWMPPEVPDPYIMVESQIIPEVPEPEFRGRDGDEDSRKARQRGLAVRYICEENRLNDLNTANERRLRKYGDAFWKAYWDDEMPCGDRRGNIRIRDVPVEDLYIDPLAGREGLQAAEYVIYLYTMHRLRFYRSYREELRRLKLAADDLTGRRYEEDDDLFAPFTATAEGREDQVQVMEFWYRTEKGDIACSIQAGGQELRHIERYWQDTGEQCKLFPFVHYWCIRDETQFYNRSELAPILPMVDGADRELAMGVLNDAFMANDIVLIEEGALADGEEFTNAPGSQVRVNQGRAGGVARLGGLGSGAKSLSMVEWMLGQIQRTNRNFDSNNGRETSKVQTASGLLQLRADAQEQQQLKRADRDAGFCRLYELLDWLALEFFRDDRLLFIGAKDGEDTPQLLRFNGAAFAEPVGGMRQWWSDGAEMHEGETAPFDAPDFPEGEDLPPQTGGERPAEGAASYYPRVDVTVSCGDPIGKSPAMTMQVLDKLAATSATEDNWRLLAAELELLDIPGKQEIIERWRQKFEPKIPPAVTAALEGDGEFLQMVTGVVEQIDAQRRGGSSMIDAQRGGGSSMSAADPMGGMGTMNAMGGGAAGAAPMEVTNLGGSGIGMNMGESL